MLKFARTAFYISLTFFFIALGLSAIYGVWVITRNDGAWLSQVIIKVTSARKTDPNEKTLASKVVDRLLDKDGELLSKIIHKATRRTGAAARNNPMSQVFDRLLANDGELLANVLAKMNNRRKKNPMNTAFDKLLANDGAILSKILIKMSRARKRPSLGEALLSRPKVISKIVGDILERAGIKALLTDVRKKVKYINTKVSLQQEIRYALRKVPSMLARTLQLQSQQKSLKNKAWKKIRIHFPTILREIRAIPCLRFALIRRGDDNQIRVRVRVKMGQKRCREMACNTYTGAIDQIILKRLKPYGVHEGHIRIKFNFGKRKCNSDR